MARKNLTYTYYAHVYKLPEEQVDAPLSRTIEKKEGWELVACFRIHFTGDSRVSPFNGRRDFTHAAGKNCEVVFKTEPRLGTTYVRELHATVGVCDSDIMITVREGSKYTQTLLYMKPPVDFGSFLEREFYLGD